MRRGGGAHIALWDGFVEAVGGEVAAAPTAETAGVRRVPGPPSGDRLSQLVRLYAIESGQPAISRTKREGLAAHYGIGDGPGNEYFRAPREGATSSTPPRAAR